MNLGFDIVPPNIGALNAQIAASASHRGGQGGSGLSSLLVKVPDWSIVSFFLLPPWSKQGILGKSVAECYDLPPRPGAKFGRHVAWSTHESIEPGITAKDPVVRTLQELQATLGDKVRKMLPARSFYLNVLVRGRSGLDSKTGNVIAESWVEENPPKVAVLRLTSGIHAELAKSVIALSSSCPPYHPSAAVIYNLARTLKPRQGGTDMTSYSLTTEGRMTAQGAVPDRLDLVKTYGEQFVSAAYSQIADLDMFFPVPTEAQRVDAEMWASSIRNSILARFRSEAPAKVFSPPVQTRQEVSPPSSVDLPQAPEASPPSGFPSPSDVKSRDLGLDAAPLKDKIPFCLGKHTVVSVSPNARWCETCAFRKACKMKAGAAK